MKSNSTTILIQGKDYMVGDSSWRVVDLIPITIQKEHILKAVKWIDEHGVPHARWPTKYLVIIDNREYPPKFVISIANLFASGGELPPELFNGGEETNSYLQHLGYEITEFSSRAQIRNGWKGPRD